MDHNILLFDSQAISLRGISVIISSIFPNLKIHEATSESEAIHIMNTKNICYVVLSQNIKQKVPLFKSANKNKISYLIYYETFDFVQSLIGTTNTSLSIVNKKSPIEDLILGIYNLLESKIYFCNRTCVCILENFDQSKHLDHLNLNNIRRHKFESLSVREKQIIYFVKEGVKTKEIADTLKLKMSTISSTKYKAFKKLMVTNIMDLINLPI